MCRADEGKLTDDEKALADIYSRIMNFARTDKTVSGQSYDLMYANPHSASFNPDRQYAFLRRSGRQLLVVVVNFDIIIIGDGIGRTCITLDNSRVIGRYAVGGVVGLGGMAYHTCKPNM